MCFRKKGNIATENSLFNLSFSQFGEISRKRKRRSGRPYRPCISPARRRRWRCVRCLKIATKAFSSFRGSQPRSSSHPSRHFSHVPLLDLCGFWWSISSCSFDRSQAIIGPLDPERRPVSQFYNSTLEHNQKLPDPEPWSSFLRWRTTDISKIWKLLRGGRRERTRSSVRVLY